VSHLSKSAVEKVVRVHADGFSTTNITVEVSTGAAFKPMKLNTNIFIPKTLDISTSLVADVATDFYQFRRNRGVLIGVLGLSTSDMGKLCAEHIESMIANPLYSQQTAAGVAIPVVYKILDACQRYFSTSPVDVSRPEFCHCTAPNDE